MKKLLSILLTAIIMASIMIVPMTTVLATEHTMDFGTGITGKFDDVTDTLTITGTGVMDDYSFMGSPIYPYKDELQTIVIESGITAIGTSTFFNCKELTSVTIPESVTSIGGAAFRDCSSLTSVTIPDGVTSIGIATFWGCSSLTSITIPDGVTSIEDHLIHDCSSLTSITIPDGVTSIGDAAFRGCSSLTSVTIPSAVTTIGKEVFMCSGVESITIPDGVTSIEKNAFYYCENLTSITIPEGVTSIGEAAFRSCIILPSITIPSTVASIGQQAFEDCDVLKTITNLYDGVQTLGSNVFCDTGQSVVGDKTTLVYPANSTFKEVAKASGYTIIAPSVTSSGQTAVESTVPVEGTVEALTISVTHPASIEYTINPNLGIGNAFVAPNIAITNNTKVPINVTVKSLTSASGGTLQFTDVAHDAQDWNNLNLADSKTYISMGIKINDVTGWNSGYNTDIRYSVDTGDVIFGSVNKDTTVNMSIVANHGLAFAQSYTAVHNLIFLFDLV